MDVQQLCLFQFSRPLLDQLGEAFFRQAPPAPGVYQFIGGGDRVLYVGQSKNLRSRLGYYKNARPEREPRRIIRLIHQVQAIRLEPCSSHAEAQARELELIQQLRPRYNVRHALSRTYGFFGVRRESAPGEAGGIRFRMSLDAGRDPEEMLVGAFTNRSLCRRAFFAAGRALWSETFHPRQIHDLPNWLLDHAKVNEIHLPGDEDRAEKLSRFLRGQSDDLARVAESFARAQSHPFLKNYFERDLLTLCEFHRLAVRMRELREYAQCGDILPQERLDHVSLARKIG